MGLVIYGENDKNYIILNKKVDKIELIKIPDSSELSSIKPSDKTEIKKVKKVYKKRNQLNKENKDCLNSFIGSGFKKITPSNSSQQINLLPKS